MSADFFSKKGQYNTNKNVGIKGIVKPLMIHVKTVSSRLLSGS